MPEGDVMMSRCSDLYSTDLAAQFGFGNEDMMQRGITQVQPLIILGGRINKKF